ncbi:MAG: phosphatidate cytidylyltransferase [Gammaproteobacteria bacterium]|nr:phosphatidate cytidylyltransferase [Gammaproteobacteria bacterium]
MSRPLSSLTQRVLTALVLVPLVVAAILLLSPPGFAALLGLFVLGGAWEWSAMAGLGDTRRRVAYVLVTAAVLGLVYGLLARPAAGPLLLLLALVWWALAAALVVRFQLQGVFTTGGPWSRGASGLLILVPAWFALVVLHRQEAGGPWLVLFLLVLIWGADTAAFFVGRRWGSRRLASRVSPGKSWEGVAGAVVAVLVLALAVGEPLGFGESLVPFLTLVALTVAASVLGDLTESLYKREAGLKDSGSLLPGHGGVLDRIDSLTAAAPLFVLGLYGMGRVA